MQGQIATCSYTWTTVCSLDSALPSKEWLFDTKDWQPKKCMRAPRTVFRGQLQIIAHLFGHHSGSFELIKLNLDTYSHQSLTLQCEAFLSETVQRERRDGFTVLGGNGWTGSSIWLEICENFKKTVLKKSNYNDIFIDLHLKKIL